VVVFPAVSAVISLICAGIIARDAIRRPRPDKIAWAIAFALFAVAAGSEVVGSLSGWTDLLVRVFYLAGAVLVVGYLALGQLYLLAAQRIQRFAPGVALLVTAISATIVWEARIDETRLAADGWDALERGTALKALAIGINAGGTAIIVGGLIYSAWRFRRLGIQRNRMIGCLLIALGTLTVAMGGTLTRLGRHEYLYIAMSVGVAIIFAGVLQTRRPGPATAKVTTPEPEAAHATETTGSAVIVVANGHIPAPTATAPATATNGHGHTPGSALGADPAIVFIETRLLPLDAERIAEECRIWSVAPVQIDAFEREAARTVWTLRLRLSPAGQERFDALPPAVRLQLAELHDEVLTAAPARTGAERIAR
jgi:hypothetical protein